MENQQESQEESQKPYKNRKIKIEKENRGEKPLGINNYGHIPHLPNSRLGSGDHHVEIGQANIATIKTRDFRDLVIVQEKLDGANVGVLKLNNTLIALTRSGHDCLHSPYLAHKLFLEFVQENHDRFFNLLQEGERIAGEWLVVTHGTHYNMPHEPFVAFDIFPKKHERIIYHDFLLRVLPFGFIVPRLLHLGSAISTNIALKRLEANRHYHGAIGNMEGVVYRIERDNKVDFLCKYVRHDKQDGLYLDEENPVFNRFV